MSETGPNREAQIAETQRVIIDGARKAIAAGSPAASVIEALRRAAKQLEGKE